jgi:hypothetical protein
MTPAQLEQLARDVEAHLSPAWCAQLLEADLAIAGALREMVDVERAKFNASGLAKMDPGATRPKVRATLYPETAKHSNRNATFGCCCRISERTLAIRAWIGADQKFINIEVTLS